jgi:hypothetical protein
MMLMKQFMKGYLWILVATLWGLQMGCMTGHSSMPYQSSEATKISFLIDHGFTARKRGLLTIYVKESVPIREALKLFNVRFADLHQVGGLPYWEGARRLMTKYELIYFFWGPREVHMDADDPPDMDTLCTIDLNLYEVEKGAVRSSDRNESASPK